MITLSTNGKHLEMMKKRWADDLVGWQQHQILHDKNQIRKRNEERVSNNILKVIDVKLRHCI